MRGDFFVGLRRGEQAVSQGGGAAEGKTEEEAARRGRLPPPPWKMARGAAAR